jgi:hypothetical protein
VSNETCALCGHFKMKEYPEHARAGLGRCGVRASTRADRIALFLPWATPACERYVAAPNIEDRKAWIDKCRAPAHNNNAAPPKTKG